MPIHSISLLLQLSGFRYFRPGFRRPRALRSTGPAHTPYLGILDVQDVIAIAANQLQWEHFSLAGPLHGSRSQRSSSIGLFPDRIERLFAIDGYAETVSAMRGGSSLHRDSIDAESDQGGPGILESVPQSGRHGSKRRKVHRSDSGFGSYPRRKGEQGMSMGGISWASDPRVRWSDALGITREQMDHNVSASFGGEVLDRGGRQRPQVVPGQTWNGLPARLREL